MKGERLGEFEEFTLLAVRALGDHTYAVPVQRYVEDATGRNVSIGAVYAALARLEAKSFLRSSMGDATARRGGKSKRLYAVTPLGLRTARDLHRVRDQNLERHCGRPAVMNRSSPPDSPACSCGSSRSAIGASEVEADLLELFTERAASRDARYARRRYYGDVLSLWTSRRQRASITGLPGPSPDLVREVGHDVAYALRLLRRSPAVVAVAVLGLGLAIGVGTSVFSLLNATALRPTGIVDPSSVVRVMRKYADGSGTSWRYAEYLHLRERTTSAALEAWLREDVSVGSAPDPESSPTTSVMFVTGGYLGSLNSRTTLGRVLSPSDNVPGASPVVVVSHTMWSRTLSSDPAVVGRTIWLNGVAFTIVGVSARGFSGMVDANPTIWAPIASYQLATGGPPVDRNPALTVNVVARLGPAALRAQAQSELNAAAVSIAGDRSDASSPLTGVHFIAITDPTNASRRVPLRTGDGHGHQRRRPRAAAGLRQRHQPSAGQRDHAPAGARRPARARRQPLAYRPPAHD